MFFASGVFYYFKKEDVKKLFTAMAKQFKGGKIVFDATNATGLKSMAKTWLESADMDSVGVYFSIEDESELKAWSNDFAQVILKGYMTGYRPLDKRYGFIANYIFRFVDRTKRCQMIEIIFKE